MIEQEEDAQVDFEDDLYDAVTVASFGGVRMNMKRGSARVHPLWLFLLCIPLFLTQQAVLLYLRLGQNLEKPVHGSADAEFILPFAKVLMIYVMAMMLYPELLAALRLILFLANPTTWTDVHRDCDQTWKWSVAVVAPISLISEAFKFFTGYLVLVDSVSVVLLCDSVQDTIFKALNLIFLTRLDNMLWQVSQRVFHVEHRQKRFVLRSKQDREEAARRLWIFIPPTCWLHRDRGVSAVENVVTSVFFMLCYCRQFLFTEYALKTDILPMARNMCMIWELTKNESWVGSVVREFLRWISLDHHPNGLLNRTCNPEMGGYCGPEYHPTKIGDMWDMLLERPVQIIVNTAIFGIINLIPQIVALVYGQDGDPNDSVDRSDADGFSQALKLLQHDIKELREMSSSETNF